MYLTDSQYKCFRDLYEISEYSHYSIQFQHISEEPSISPVKSRMLILERAMHHLNRQLMKEKKKSIYNKKDPLPSGMGDYIKSKINHKLLQ